MAEQRSADGDLRAPRGSNYTIFLTAANNHNLVAAFGQPADKPIDSIVADMPRVAPKWRDGDALRSTHDRYGRNISEPTAAPGSGLG